MLQCADPSIHSNCVASLAKSRWQWFVVLTLTVQQATALHAVDDRCQIRAMLIQAVSLLGDHKC